MKRYVLGLAFFLIGCDPVYQLDYVVKNETDQTIHVVDRYDTAFPGRPFLLHPGESDTVVNASGVGYSRPVFEENKDDVWSGLIFTWDTSKCKDCMFKPKADWIYSESNRCNGNATLTIK
ncbi:MAG TPA: hypothetical protein VL651_02920 [Bacteroidia bacterium]|jgi:hypothetical protein|nr:hypothetical protein [Bacteroidia bacterium]